MDASFNLVESFADVERFMTWLGERRTWMAVDTETSGLDWWRDKLRLVQIGDPHTAWAFSWEDWTGVIKEVLHSYQGATAYHNAKFDVHFLETNGVKLNRSVIHDTRAMAHILEPGLPSGLKAVGTRSIHPSAALGDRELKAVMMKNRWEWGTIPISVPQYWQYACLDVILTSRIAEAFYPDIHNSYKELYEIEVWNALTLVDMERRGIRVDLAFCHENVGKISEYEVAMEQWFLDTYGLKNPRSTAQVAQVFLDAGVNLIATTKSGQWQMDEWALSGINHPMAQEILNYREQIKIRSTYLDDFISFADGDVLHGSINPLGARTGRMSMQRPNLQNVPRSWVRSAFIPRPGNKLVLVDFDQIEFRLLAHYAGEQSLIQAVLDGDDLHSYVGRMVYNQAEISREQRQIVKHANFAKIYGAGVEKFAATAGISVPDAQSFNEKYDRSFPAIVSWVNKITGIGNRASRDLITPYLGRRQVVQKGHGGYKLVNYFIQGTAVDVLKRKIVELSMTNSDQFMLFPIHDEIAFDVPEEYVEDIQRETALVMQDLTSFSVPLTVGSEVVNNWGEKYV